MRQVLIASVSLLALSAGAAMAGPNTVWTVDVSATGSGTSSNAYAEQFSTDGTKLRQVALGSGFSPGGIALQNNTIYVASTTDGTIRTYNATTGAAGITISTGHAAYGSIAFDSTGFWANDYEGGNKAFHITLAGVNDKTVTLSNCGSYCNGLDVFTRNNLTYLIANRGETEASATYDLYTLSGSTATLATAGLLKNVANGAGVVYNGTGFYVADSIDNALLSYDFNGTSLTSAALTGPIPDSGFGNARFATDLAFQVPEPMSLALFAAGLGALGIARRRRA